MGADELRMQAECKHSVRTHASSTASSGTHNDTSIVIFHFTEARVPGQDFPPWLIRVPVVLGHICVAVHHLETPQLHGDIQSQGDTCEQCL